MTPPGTESNPIRIAIIGAGPAGFYAAEYLFRQPDLKLEVDVYDRLPTPYGLVRSGVAPDHQKIKNVTRVFDKTASNPAFRFFGNVEYGRDLSLEDLKTFYHQVYFSTGAQIDRPLNIPGEDLPRSHSATEFVAWYNGHPDFRDLEFDLSRDSVAVIGVGNVAIDVARILCKTVDELAPTDIADYALEALAESRIRDVYMLGRRGPAQAAFTNPEIKEMGILQDASTVILEEELKLDPLSAAALEAAPDRLIQKMLDMMETYIGGTVPGASKTCHIRFLLSPIELLAADDGGVGSMRVVRNRLVESKSGRLSSMPTDTTFELPVGLVFRSVGYRGVSLPDIPFNVDWGVVPNESGRVVDKNGKVQEGCYVGGWIKRGPTGVIGTNKRDANETVSCMVEDLAAGRHFHPEAASAEAVENFLRSRRAAIITYADWLRIDELETAAGAESNRPRIKFTSLDEVLEALDRQGPVTAT